MASIKHEGFRQLRGDGDNHTFGIVVGEASRALHVLTADDIMTDWNVSSYTHPTILVHSATTPATNYIKLYHDASNGVIDVDGVEALRLTESTTGADVRFLGDTPASNYLLWDASGAPHLAIYTTSSSTSGSTSIESLYSKMTMTGTGGVGGRARFHLYTDVTLGGWANALKAYAELGTSGRITGLLSAMNAELSMPNVNMGSAGTYFPLEINYAAGGSSIVTAGSPTGNRVGFIYMAQSGDSDGDFDDNAFFFQMMGMTAGGGHLFDSTADTAAAQIDHSLKIAIGGGTYYIPLMDNANGS